SQDHSRLLRQGCISRRTAYGLRSFARRRKGQQRAEGRTGVRGSSQKPDGRGGGGSRAARAVHRFLGLQLFFGGGGNQARQVLFERSGYRTAHGQFRGV